MTTETIPPVVHRHQPWYKILYVQVLIAIALGVLIGYFYPRSRQGAEAARRRLHRADQDDDRAGDLLHRRARHFLDGRSEARRPCRPEGADLFRGGLDGGAGDRPARRRSAAARPRLQHRSGLDRSEIRRHLRHPGEGTGHRRASDGDHSGQLFRRAGAWRSAAGAAGLDPLRLCHRVSRQDRRADLAGGRPGRQDVLRHHPHDRARRADRRVRRDGVHRRRLRPRLAVEPDRADRARSI